MPGWTSYFWPVQSSWFGPCGVLQPSWPPLPVSEPPQSPADVAYMTLAPTPRTRIGFQVVARPVVGSIAPIPCRDTAPGPAELRPLVLSSHRRWPATYTVEPVTATLCSVSPPV